MNDALQGRIEATAAMLLRSAEARGFWISGDLRVGLKDAAALAGYTHGGLRNAIAEGRGPHCYTLGGGGHQRTLRLLDLAAWLEGHRDY